MRQACRGVIYTNIQLSQDYSTSWIEVKIVNRHQSSVNVGKLPGSQYTIEIRTDKEHYGICLKEKMCFSLKVQEEPK